MRGTPDEDELSSSTHKKNGATNRRVGKVQRMKRRFTQQATSSSGGTAKREIVVDGSVEDRKLQLKRSLTADATIERRVNDTNKLDLSEKENNNDEQPNHHTPTEWRRGAMVGTLETNRRVTLIRERFSSSRSIFGPDDDPIMAVSPMGRRGKLLTAREEIEFARLMDTEKTFNEAFLTVGGSGMDCRQTGKGSIFVMGDAKLGQTKVIQTRLNKAARIVQRFVRYSVAILSVHKAHFKYWKDEQADIERRRVEELEDVERMKAIQKHLFMIELEREYEETLEEELESKQKVLREYEQELATEKQEHDILAKLIRQTTLENCLLELQLKDPEQADKAGALQQRISIIQSQKDIYTLALDQYQDMRKALKKRIKLVIRETDLEQILLGIVKRYIKLITDLLKDKTDDPEIRAELKNIKKQLKEIKVQIMAKHNERMGWKTDDNNNNNNDSADAKANAEARAKEEAEKRRLEAEERRKQAIAERRRLDAAYERLQKEEEERQRAEFAKIRSQVEEKKRAKAEVERRRKEEEERQKAEEERRRKQEEEERQKAEEEGSQKSKAEQEGSLNLTDSMTALDVGGERRRLDAAYERLQKEEEERQRAEFAKIRSEVEEKKRAKAEAERRRKEEEERQKAEAGQEGSLNLTDSMTALDVGGDPTGSNDSNALGTQETDNEGSLVLSESLTGLRDASASSMDRNSSKGEVEAAPGAEDSELSLEDLMQDPTGSKKKSKKKKTKRGSSILESNSKLFSLTEEPSDSPSRRKTTKSKGKSKEGSSSTLFSLSEESDSNNDVSSGKTKKSKKASKRGSSLLESSSGALFAVIEDSNAPRGKTTTKPKRASQRASMLQSSSALFSLIEEPKASDDDEKPADSKWESMMESFVNHDSGDNGPSPLAKNRSTRRKPKKSSMMESSSALFFLIEEELEDDGTPGKKKTKKKTGRSSGMDQSAPDFGSRYGMDDSYADYGSSDGMDHSAPAHLSSGRRRNKKTGRRRMSSMDQSAPEHTRSRMVDESGSDDGSPDDMDRSAPAQLSSERRRNKKSGRRRRSSMDQSAPEHSHRRMADTDSDNGSPDDMDHSAPAHLSSGRRTNKKAGMRRMSTMDESVPELGRRKRDGRRRRMSID
ncbi:expressed unknown protein [Seminavis robusta]|uniref:Uncharacterized protein n=1 Tax=Seminavis robusta TaxID=568900 RepID=A0A9N8HBF1_9STRA|nr:expressed unknown protein [Seminavis robusta]|eukprot:Sro180_g078900.1 n/a (1120) ;mRNA; r:92547-95906